MPLKIVGEVHAQALVRSRREAELAAALAEITRLKESLDVENTYLRPSAHARSVPVLARRSPRFNRMDRPCSSMRSANQFFRRTGTT